MINLTKYELKQIAENRGIKNYRNMSRDELLNTMAESERIFKNQSQNGLKNQEDCKNGESFTKRTQANCRNARFITK